MKVISHRILQLPLAHQGILDASFGMIEKNYEEDEHKDLRIELKSGNKAKEPIR